tara:strand:+ start:387 stop:602 length:216 start_codon:yes stop_codon:yes gene_type:complete
MKLTQKQKVLRHLKEIGAITPVQAFFDYSVMRLAAIVFNLKDEGYNIKTTILKSENKFGEPVRYAQYKLEQ